MEPVRHHALPFALSALDLALAAPALASDNAPELRQLVVTGSRVAHDSFDLPAAIDSVDREQIITGQARVDASEALATIPGLTVLNRQNYAQDLQISSRGFGARSAFGVRGLKIITDGIPASTPDGQGQLSTFNLDQAERIEVLRGPLSAVYGNSAGGVVQLFTRDGQGAPTVEGTTMAGSHGTRRNDVSLQGEHNGVGYVLDTSRFQTDGYREHSAATRDQSLAKLTFRPDDQSRLSVVASTLRQLDTQDPLGVRWGTFQSTPRLGELDTTDPLKRSIAERYNTRKSIEHVQGGATYERRSGQDSFLISAYTGTRQVVQYQATPSGPQANPRHSGGVVDFDREFQGLALRWTRQQPLAGGQLTTIAGIDYDQSRDNRRGYENFITTGGTTVYGVKGALRRQETDTVSSLDPYVQAEWQLQRWAFSAGLRHSRVRFDVADSYLSNGNDSGNVSFTRTTPTVGVVYKATPLLNLYASAARGFETPTLNEMFYSGNGGSFNFGLKPATSRHLEAGAKAWVGEQTRVNLAVFDIHTDNELVVDQSSGGRTSYKNAPGTQRQGVELSLDARWGQGLSGRLAFSQLRATYSEDFLAGTTAVNAGNTLPGVARRTAYGELAWRHTPSGITTALEVVHRSQMYVEDTNTAQAAPGYTVANLRISAEQAVGRAWKLREFVRIDNLADKSYVGSVIVADANQRYYEAAPQRTWLAGVSASYRF